MDGRSGAGHDSALKVRVACAGPLPVLGPGDEAGVNGVPLNVIADALEFGGIPNPMIKISRAATPLMTPEILARGK